MLQRFDTVVAAWLICSVACHAAPEQIVTDPALNATLNAAQKASKDGTGPKLPEKLHGKWEAPRSETHGGEYRLPGNDLAD